ncbi:MAG: 3-phosphoshikimate 1-carboxyvinyltransferase [Pyrinomonadaceae bacterium]|nr:3-phosphoshikimate 1-carboxyvinyltransferase [Pyrinomonadaceae bacterium]
MRIAPARRLKGSIRLPGDKSISHRAALIAALAQGESNLANFSPSRDCASTLSCLAQLGVRIERNGNEVRVQGVGIGGLSAPTEALDCGNSGSTMRMLAGVLAGHNFSATLTGDESLSSRPMRRIIEPLEMMGAAFECEQGYPPLRIKGHQPLNPISYELPVASAQVKTCLLLAGLHAEGRTEVVERLGATRDHTERLLRWFGIGAPAGNDASVSACAVEGPARSAGRDVSIPGDFSSAAFLIAAAALLPASELVVEGLGLNPTRTQLLDVLLSLGANIETTETQEVCNELRGTLRIKGMESGDSTADSKITGGTPVPHSQVTIDGQLSAALIDELPLVAVIGTRIPGGVVIRDAKELRFKETDRIAATVANLRAMGAEVAEYEDGLMTNSPVRLHGAKLDSYGDHRIAMAFTVAALLAQGESELIGSECVAVSFPEFFECLESVVER